MRISLTIAALSLLCVTSALGQGTAVVRGRVLDSNGQPMAGVTVRVEGTDLSATTDDTGVYRLSGVPPGPQVIRAQRLGYALARVPTTIPGRGEVTVDVHMSLVPLQLEGITVTADVSGRARGEVATATVIETDAIRHQTATSLSGVLELLPGVELQPPSLGGVQQIPLRTAGTSGIAGGASANDLAAFGTLIVLDGVPLSNNANLQSLGPRGELSFATNAGGGIDLREIPAATLERVEVIRGVPSARYGDLTQGAIIVDTHVGSFDPEVRVQYDANTVETTTLGGWDLGATHGLTANFDFARTRTSPGVTDDLANRVAAQLRHAWRVGASDAAGIPKLLLDSRVDFYRLYDDRPENPNTRPGRSSTARDQGLRISERARWRLGKDLRLTATAAFTRVSQRSFAQSELVRGAMPITDRLEPGRQEGTFVLGQYTADLTVDGAPALAYGRVELEAKRDWLGLVHALRAGGELRREWNHGEGYQFDVALPPQVTFNGVQGYDRPRSYVAIPGVATSALYVDDRIVGALPAHMDYQLQLGLRLDALHRDASWLPKVRDTKLEPRVSAELSVLPWLRLRGGWGRTAKTPSLSNLYPAPQYNDVVNVNYFANDPVERLAVLTTFIFDPTNPDLGFSTAEKAEAGIEIGMGRSAISLVAFHDKLKDGVGFRQDITSLLREHYQLTDSITGNGIKPEIIEPASSVDSVPIIVERPANHIALDSRGFELTATLPEIPAIKTRIQVQGSFVKTDWRSNAVHFGTASRFSDFQLSTVQQRAPYWEGVEEVGKSYLLTYRLIHHQPALGLIITATIQHNLKDFVDDVNSRDTLAFAGYVTRGGQLVPVSPADRTLPQYQDLRLPRGGLIQPLATPADWMMGLQVSKTMPLDGELRFWGFNVLDRVGRYAAAGQHSRVYRRVQFGVELNLRPAALIRGWR